jgi:hypothetical protein
MNGCHVPAFGPEPYRTRLTGQLANFPYFSTLKTLIFRIGHPIEYVFKLEIAKINCAQFTNRDSPVNPKS